METMSATKLWALIIGITAGLMAVLTGLSFAFDGWLAHLLVTSGSVVEASVILAVLAMPALVIGATLAFAIEKPLGS